jgi:uncharacterized protein YxjI
MSLVKEVAGVSLATQSHFVIKRAWWSFFDRVFRIYTGDGQLIMYVKHPLMRLREEFIVYEDEAQSRPLLHIKSRQIVAINFAYEIRDAATDAVLGSVEKRGLRSLIRDKFVLRDAGGNEIGYAQEHGASILRRLFPFLTSKHEIVVNSKQAAFMRQRFRFFIKEFAVDTEPSAIDPRFVLAVALLAVIAEVRREERRSFLDNASDALGG